MSMHHTVHALAQNRDVKKRLVFLLLAKVVVQTATDLIITGMKNVRRFRLFSTSDAPFFYYRPIRIGRN